MGTLYTDGNAIGISTLEIGVKIYALVASFEGDLKIIEIKLSNIRN